jgi:hypothetical protein
MDSLAVVVETLRKLRYSKEFASSFPSVRNVESLCDYLSKKVGAACAPVHLNNILGLRTFLTFWHGPNANVKVALFIAILCLSHTYKLAGRR